MLQRESQRKVGEQSTLALHGRTDTKSIEDLEQLKRSALVCPHPFLREELLVTAVRAYRIHGRAQEAESLLISEGYPLAAADWHRRRENFDGAISIIRQALQGKIDDTKGVSRNALLRYLAFLECKAGNPVAAVDALVESGNLRWALDISREFRVTSRLKLTAELAPLDGPHSFAAAMGRATTPAAVREWNEERKARLLSEYRNLPNYSLRGLLGGDNKDFTAANKEFSMSLGKQQIRTPQQLKIIEHIKSTGDWEFASDVAEKVGRELVSKGDRENAALVFSQGIYTLREALNIATTPRNQKLLTEIAERVAALSQCHLKNGSENTIRMSEQFGTYIIVGLESLLLKLTFAGDSIAETEGEHSVDQTSAVWRRCIRSWDIQRGELAKELQR